MHPTAEVQSLVDCHDQPFLIIDDNHRVAVVNQAFEQFAGILRSQALGRSCHELIGDRRWICPGPAAGSNCPFADVFERRVSRTASHSYLDTEGRRHEVRIQAYPICTGEGRTYLGELIQLDGTRHHPRPDDTACPGGQMVGSSPAFRVALERLRAAARTDAPILLQGETGTGKELAAAYVHRHSARHAGPFQTLDCSVLSEPLFESEVFGHERGSFTGSIGEKAGLFEQAERGTLFLDEVGELSQPLQAKLLRVLESGEFRRVGGLKTRRTNTRIICATNRQLLGASWFRSDLYFRIACLTVNLPSLAERRSDIPLLAAELLERIGQSSGRRYSIDEGALWALQDYDFLGNIRELRNLLWVAAVNAPGGHIGAEHIVEALPKRAARGGVAREHRTPSTLLLGSGADQRMEASRQGWDADQLAAVLRRHRGNRRAVADELGVSERTIYRQLRRLGLN